ncbi:MAG: bacillithiol system redox-active protein YtxJ [Cyclonatronaceae bacterium]
MSFFDKFRSFSAGPQLSESWLHPQTAGDIDAIFEESAGDKNTLYLIYKHSFSCGICSYSLRRLEERFGDFSPHVKPYFIDVRAQRALSNRVAEKSGVAHQSPQAILLYDGAVYWSDSHGGVRAEPVLESLEELGIRGKKS